MSDVSIDVKINMPKVLNKVENEAFGLFLIREWKRLINPFTPHRDGNLERNVLYNPFAVTYLSPYAHYMYNGIQYIDPILNVSGFTNDGGITFYSRAGVKKIPSGKPFNYLKEVNPQATDHWDKAAEKAGQKEKLIAAANAYLRR